MQEISILGSTGSIGTQALSVIARHPDRFHACALVAHASADLLFQQVRAFRPKLAGLVVEPTAIPEDLRFCQWVFGPECLTLAAQAQEAQSVLVSVVGFAGIFGVLSALKAHKRVLLANKEPLVAAGEWVTRVARENGASLIPVDSEHSAIFQCLEAAGPNKPERLILTASGGPFRTWSKADMDQATVEQALKHPNWTMGHKITVDSASMMNKALEIIEAHWLFDMPGEQIDVMIHPQSVIHSMVAFKDGALLAQMGTPDMRVPILYAMAYPERLSTGASALTLEHMSQLTFEKADAQKFIPLRLAYEVLQAGGTSGAVFNGANEAAVEAFLSRRIRFGQISQLVEEALSRVGVKAVDCLDTVLDADRAAREIVGQMLRAM